MESYKKLLFLMLSIITLAGCSNDDGANLSLVITDFQPSYDKVVLKWKLVRPGNITIQDLQIYRKEKNADEDGTFQQATMIANLPSNETTYTDLNVPYKSEVSYYVMIRYIKNGTSQTMDFLESEPMIFSRNLVLFNKVPLQVQQDPLDSDFFHILDKYGSGTLKKYSFSQKEIAASKGFTNGWLMNNRFHIVNNEIYVADTEGKISRVNANNYQSVATYNTAITNTFNAFALDGDRIYYQDKNIWKYYSISTGISTSTGNASDMTYVETMSPNKFFFMYAYQGGYGFNIKGYSPLTCTSSTCSADYTIYPTGPVTVPVYRADPYIFTWNPTKDKFVTSYEGWVFNLSTLQPELKLSEITGKHYFNFVYDSAGNLYASVQGEKLIHKFNSSYQLLDTIPTKLYPFYPMVTNNGLHVIGTYEKIDYWGIWYGYEFNFDVKCAIEVLP